MCLVRCLTPSHNGAKNPLGLLFSLTMENEHLPLCSSLHSLKKKAFGASVRKTGKLPQAFSCLIIDEACQAVELDCLIPLQHGVSKIIAVGDPEQLPSTVLSKTSQKLKFGISLFERLYKLFQTQSRELFRSDAFANFNPVLLLDTQYRMHPDICVFPSNHVYDGRVKTDSSVVERLSTRKCPFRPLLFFDLVDSKEIADGRGAAAGPSVSNFVEAVFTVSKIVVPYSIFFKISFFFFTEVDMGNEAWIFNFDSF